MVAKKPTKTRKPSPAAADWRPQIESLTQAEQQIRQARRRAIAQNVIAICQHFATPISPADLASVFSALGYLAPGVSPDSLKRQARYLRQLGELTQDPAYGKVIAELVEQLLRESTRLSLITIAQVAQGLTPKSYAAKLKQLAAGRKSVSELRPKKKPAQQS